MRKAVIDLGSNSFHLLLADVTDTGFTAVLRKRAMLHLGREIAINGVLKPAVLKKVADTTGSFVSAAKKQGAESVRIVATAAIRDAANRDVIVAAISEATGLDVSVLSPEAEGKYAFHGVTSRSPAPAGPRTVCDLGGGSLEIITGTTAADATVWSVPVGVSRLLAHATTDPLSADDIEAIKTAVTQQLATISPVIDESVTLIGGSVRALARLLDATSQPSTRQSLHALTETLVALPMAKRQALKGMRKRRVDHLHVAAIILDTLLERYGIDTFTVSDSGLREGVMLETRRPQVRTLRPAYRRNVTADAIGSRVSIRHLLTDPEQGTVPSDVVGRLAAFDGDLALVVDRHGALHMIDVAMILASRVIPAHPTRPPEPAVGTKEQPVLREAARAVIMQDDRLLLVAHHPEPDRTVWTAPGGGQVGDETLPETVTREIREELGVAVHVGPALFTRTATFAFRGVWLEQHETWFVADAAEPVNPADAPLNDAGTSKVRAFSLTELTEERDLIAPDDLADRVAHLFTPGSRLNGAPSHG